VHFDNACLSPQWVNAIWLTHNRWAPWRLAGTDTAPFAVPPHGTLTVRVEYKPTTLADASQAVLAVVKAHHTAQVTLYGKPFVSGCAPIQLFGPNPLNIGPGDVIQIEASDPALPSTELPAQFAWKLTVPAASATALTVAADTRSATFKPDRGGVFRICAQLASKAKGSQCRPACRDVEVPYAPLHVELTWSSATPTVGPPTGKPVDLDLHLGHPAGTGGPDGDCDGTGDPWFTSWDCWELYASASWGAAANGPAHATWLGNAPSTEVVQLAPQISSPAQYTLGVHSWRDPGGTSSATVRVFVFGNLVGQWTHPGLQVGDFWTVGRLNWPNQGGGTGNAKPLEACLQSGDACALAKPTQWQATGTPCLTPCYPVPGGIVVKQLFAPCPSK